MIKKIVAGILYGTLAFMAPGLECYAALGAQFSEPGGGVGRVSEVIPAVDETSPIIDGQGINEAPPSTIIQSTKKLSEASPLVEQPSASAEKPLASIPANLKLSTIKAQDGNARDAADKTNQPLPKDKRNRSAFLAKKLLWGLGLTHNWMENWRQGKQRFDLSGTEPAEEEAPVLQENISPTSKYPLTRLKDASAAQTSKSSTGIEKHNAALSLLAAALHPENINAGLKKFAAGALTSSLNKMQALLARLFSQQPPPAAEESLGQDPPAAPGYSFSQFNRLRKNVLDYLTWALDTPEAKAAGITRLRPLPFKDIYIVTDPAMARQILEPPEADNFIRARGTIGRIIMSKFFGRSIISADGKEHHDIRRQLHSPFLPKAVRAYTPDVIGLAVSRVEEWKAGEEFNLSEEMITLAMEVFIHTFIGIDKGPASTRIMGVVHELADTLAESLRSIPLPAWVPTRLNHKQALVRKKVDEAMYGLIEERQNHPHATPNLLDALIAAEPLTPERKVFIRDQMAALFFAGHETTASLLSWTFYLISEHPAVEQKLREELAQVAGTRPVASSDVDNLPYFKMVIQEALRLYPPAWVVDREPLKDIVLGGYRIPKGKEIWIPVVFIHRDPKLFEKPDEFLPERFINHEPGHQSVRSELKQAAYLPFGAGNHYCLGHAFAMESSVSMVAAILQRWHLSRPGGPEPVPTAYGSLSVDGGLKMIATTPPPQA